ncbi:MAG TPA: outer membrane protein assembly factor BamD [Terriglobales bacterium]|nr:outer membrane protein assembly factor BamD [Terriglobales bacterium]
MLKRSFAILGIFIVLFALGACSNKKVTNPIAAVDSKQPDKILFDRAMDAMKQGKYDVARLTLQTLINTYPDSEYVARAKLAIGDSWYAEGGSAALTQAENEYKDFETFFPNTPEAAEAQLKIANIHFREMEKPDRDYTHALRAEEEYRYLITQYPDSKLVPEAKQKLLQVQEVLGEREFRIARFYYLRGSINPAIARFKTLVETYPLYSKADEALFLLGSCYQKEADGFRNMPVSSNLPEAAKGQMIKHREDLAAAAYSQIITEYPVEDYAPAAKKALEDMHRPVPTPTPEAIARDKAIEASRSDPNFRERVMLGFSKGPDLYPATKVGEPTLVDPPMASAVKQIQDIKEETQQAVQFAKNGGTSNEKLTVEAGTGTPPPNEAPPRSDAPPATPASTGDSGTATDANGIPELKPIAPENSDAQPATQPAQPPTQLNEMDSSAAAPGSSSSSSSPSSSASGSTSSSSNPPAATSAQGQNSQQQPADDYSTSKKQKKKGLHKLIPF